VLRVADLAYLDLTEAELETYRAQIDEILEYIGKAERAGTRRMWSPMAQVVGGRPDGGRDFCAKTLWLPCAVAEDILKQAPDPEPPYFRVPKGDRAGNRTEGFAGGICDLAERDL